MLKKILFYTILLVGLACSKDDDHQNTLLPETQEGAGTFACYVDGEPFIDDSGGWFNCFYQLVDGGYYFGIQGKDESYKHTPNPWGISLGTINKTMSENETLKLLEETEENAAGGGFFSFSITDNHAATTNADYTGELTITKLDFKNKYCGRHLLV